MTKSTDTHSDYVILTAFPQQWLVERASVLRFTYLACLVRLFITDEVTSISSPCFINSKLILDEGVVVEEHNDSWARTLADRAGRLRV